MFLRWKELPALGRPRNVQAQGVDAMISKPIVSTFLFSTLATIAACGGNDNPATDGGNVDACVGHTCPTDTGPSVLDPEGGQIIFEHMTFDTEAQAVFQLPAGVNTATRVMAYFMSAQTPDSNPLPMAGKCNNLAATKGWPLFVGSPHTDLDVGTLTITGKNEAGADVSFDIPKQPKGVDQIGRPHDIFYQFVQPKAADLLKPDSSYDVKFGGSATVPATTFSKAIYLAGEYTSVQNPGLEGNGPLTATADFPVSWTPGVSATKPPDSALVANNILGVTWILDVTGSPTHMCVGLVGDGMFKIPAATIAEYKVVAAARGQITTKAVMLRNAIAHQVVRLPLTTGATTNRRRIDMISLECWVQVMDVQ
jgi:hypothetical protein